MSGPVWKLIRVPGPCDSCGETVPETLSVGTIVDFGFRPDARYCRPCYDRWGGRHDQLDPRAVSEQQVPPSISLPSSASDVD